MKKKILTIIMMLTLVLSNFSTTQAEVIHYKKYKNFKYEYFDYKSIDVRYYTGKKSKVAITNDVKKIETEAFLNSKSQLLKTRKIRYELKFVSQFEGQAFLLPVFKHTK